MLKDSLPGCFSLVAVLFPRCSIIDEKIFPKKDFPEKDESEKQFETILLQGGPRIIFEKGNPDFPVILYSYGNKEWLRKKKVQKHLSEFLEHGYTIAAYDYTGYGPNAKGKATAQQACKDIEKVYHYLTQTQKIPSEKIIVFGYSVGSGPSCYLASKHRLGGVILIAPFASAMQVRLICSLPFDRFPNADYLSRAKVPLLIYHGTEDPTVPYRNSVKIYKKANGPKTFITIPGATHRNIFERIKDRFWLDMQACFPHENNQNAVEGK